jgi:hypothetical protein
MSTFCIENEARMPNPVRQLIPIRIVKFLCGASLIGLFFVATSLHVNSAIVFQDDLMANINPNMPAKMKIDIAKVEAAGIRVITGKHLTLYTDVRDSPAIEELPEIFDQAVPLWCEYFQVDVEKTKPYRIAAFVMADEAKFRKAELIPSDLPPFPAGLNRGHETWIYAQKDAYYTRHLLIHEGTHAFMQWFGNGVGAPWYGEGMAELLAVHQWQDEKLVINARLTDRRQSEGWGRPKIINDELAAGNFKTIDDVLLFPSTAFQEVKSYAWSWSACEFFGNHKLTREKFNEMQKQVHTSPAEFNETFYNSIRGDIETLETDWRLFVEEMDYGYLVAQGSVSELETVAASEVNADSSGKSFRLRTDRSWQRAASVEAKMGDKFRIVAQGRFEIGASEIDGVARPWPCEANGITLEYFRGRPLGEVQAIFLGQAAGKSSIPDPIVVGIGKVITAPNDGFLCLRVNESPAKLGDNKGTLEIGVEKID